MMAGLSSLSQKEKKKTEKIENGECNMYKPNFTPVGRIHGYWVGGA